MTIFIILAFLATFSAGAVFGFLITMADYERKICAGEYFTPQEKEELAELQLGKDRWVWRGKRKTTKAELQKVCDVLNEYPLTKDQKKKKYAKQQREEFGYGCEKCNEPSWGECIDLGGESHWYCRKHFSKESGYPLKDTWSKKQRKERSYSSPPFIIDPFTGVKHKQRKELERRGFVVKKLPNYYKILRKK